MNMILLALLAGQVSGVWVENGIMTVQEPFTPTRDQTQITSTCLNEEISLVYTRRVRGRHNVDGITVAGLPLSSSSLSKINDLISENKIEGVYVASCEKPDTGYRLKLAIEFSDHSVKVRGAPRLIGITIINGEIVDIN